MKRKLVITRLEEKQLVMSALFEDDEIKEIHCQKESQSSILGNIYVGKVQNIVSNIQAAFIEIEDGTPCYYSLRENPEPIFLNSKKDLSVNAGDEILVQVSKENIKTKAPVVTSNLNFTGKYVVLTTGNKRIGVSNKIDAKDKARIRSFLESYISEEYGFVVRTNAREASEEEIVREAQTLAERYRHIRETALHRTCFSCVYQSLPFYISDLRDTYMDSLEEIITDQRDLFEEMEDYLKEFDPSGCGQLRFYEDKLLPLAKLYSLEVRLGEVLKERVWLKSGAYLIIQPTEALTVIDVNTGKYIKKKQQQQTFLKINLEAAKEIARQLRLRNLSGIIVVDFIDMLTDEYRETLLQAFEKYLNEDPVKTNLMGMSRLHLAELTRKKVRRPLHEDLTSPCPVCKGSGFLY